MGGRKLQRVSVQVETTVIPQLTPPLTSWVFLGVAYTGLEDDEEAEEAYKRAIEINPENMLGWQGLVSFYEKRNKLTELASTLNQLIPRVVAR